MPISICTDSLREAAGSLRAGDRILLSGPLYTARDAAHKRLFALLDEGQPLPFPLMDAVIYYSGSTPPRRASHWPAAPRRRDGWIFSRPACMISACVLL